MDPNPKSAKFKFAFTGTNSSGKTTMALGVTARLKEEYHVLAEVVSSQDRKITWKDDHFPVNIKAHFGMICNLIHAEVQAELKGDAEVVITDRSVLDLFAIAKTDHPNHPALPGLWAMVEQWALTYTKIYYLPPLAYQEDGKRPPDDFRMRTHARLVDILKTENFSNVVMDLPRSDAFKDILKVIGKEVIKPIWAYDEKWLHVANSVQVTIAVKHPRNSVTSDVDVWLLPDSSFLDQKIVDYAGDCVRAHFGDQIKDVHILQAPLGALNALHQLGEVSVYHPTK